MPQLVDPQPLPDAVLEQQQALALLQQCLFQLLPREERALRSCFGIDCEIKIQRQLGREYGVTPERIRQIIEKAKRKLRSKQVMRKVFTMLTGHQWHSPKKHTAYTLPPLTTEYQRQLQTYYMDKSIEDISDQEYNELMTEYEAGLIDWTDATARTKAILRLGDV
jgi:hypothetical protein